MGVIQCRELDRRITEVQLKPAGSAVRLETQRVKLKSTGSSVRLETQRGGKG